MVRKYMVSVVAMIAIIAMVISGCTTPTPPPPIDPPTPVVRTTGPWVDAIIYREETSQGAGITKLEQGDIDIWWMLGITDPTLTPRITGNPDLKGDLSFGSYTELMFNPYGPNWDDGTWNPFSDAKIREAFNWLIDRDYFIGELLAGAGNPIFALAGAAFPEYKRYPKLFADIADFYAHNPVKGKAIIAERMEANGAELVGGTWHKDGEELVINFLIRIDLYRPLYPPAGEYMADVMEQAGFKVNKMMVTGPQSWDIWIFGDQTDGSYHAYTGGWGITAIPRDEAARFLLRDTKDGRPWPRWLLLEPPADYYQLAKDLYDGKFATLAQREQMFSEACWKSMEYSAQVLVADIAGVNPYSANLQIRGDLSYGFSWGSAQTIAFLDEAGNPKIGGTVRGDQYLLMSQPWNPVDGTGASPDLSIFRTMLQEAAFMPDGRDGLSHPWRASSGAVTIKQGLPVGKTLDWVTLNFAPTITVPPDAWADWDPVAQQFITTAARFGETVTVNRKSVVTYPLDLWDVPMHDGSNLHIADFIMSMIVTFDRAKPESAIYDEGRVPGFNTFMGAFKGVKIISVNPLVIESYYDTYALDAEQNVASWFPSYGIYSQFAPWHVITIGALAEEDGRLAWSTKKASALQREWMDYTKGPSLAWLAGYLVDALAAGYIPYEPTLGLYLTEAEAKERYTNLQAWYGKVGHFWTTTAPFYLHDVAPIAKIVELRRFEDHPDPIDRWQFLMTPPWY